jgi:hypothetical protein
MIVQRTLSHPSCVTSRDCAPSTAIPHGRFRVSLEQLPNNATESVYSQSTQHSTGVASCGIPLQCEDLHDFSAKIQTRLLLEPQGPPTESLSAARFFHAMVLEESALPEALPDLIHLLPFLFASDDPGLPKELLASTVLMRHEFLQLRPDEDQYLQQTVSPAVSAALQAMREAAAGSWQLGRLEYRVVPSDRSKGQDLFVKARAGLEDWSASVSIIAVLEELDEAPAAKDLHWQFYDLAEDSDLHLQWHPTIAEAARSAGTLDGANAADNPEDYWGPGSPTLNSASSGPDSSFLDVRSPKSTQSFFPLLADTPADERLPLLPTPTNGRTGETASPDVAALRQALQGVYEIFVQLGPDVVSCFALNLPARKSLHQEGRSRIFLDVAASIAQQAARAGGGQPS